MFRQASSIGDGKQRTLKTNIYLDYQEIISTTLHTGSHHIQCEYDFRLFLQEVLGVPDIVLGQVGDNLHMRAVVPLIITGI